MIRAVIFDCFGVLVGRGFSATYEAAGGDPIKDAVFIENTLQKLNTGAISNQLFAATVSSKLGITEQRWEEVIREDEKPNIELLEYIQTELKPAYKIGLLSNTSVGVIEHRIPAAYLDVFDEKVLSAEVHLVKPQHEIYNLILDKLGISADEAIFIDDREKYVRPAQELGMSAILYKSNSQTIREVSAILQKQNS